MKKLHNYFHLDNKYSNQTHWSNIVGGGGQEENKKPLRQNLLCENLQIGSSVSISSEGRGVKGIYTPNSQWDLHP